MVDRTLDYVAGRGTRRVSRLAVTSFVFGCCSPAVYCGFAAFIMFGIGIPRLNDGPPLPQYVDVAMNAVAVVIVACPVVALVTGIVALRRIAASGGRLRAKPLAWVGVTIGAVFTVLFAIAFAASLVH